MVRRQKDGEPRDPTAAGSQRGHVHLLVSGTESGGRLALVESTEESGEGPPCHQHQREDETLYVVEGEVVVWQAGAWTRLTAGSAMFLPCRTEHTFMVTSGPAKLLVMVSPAGLEQLFAELGGQSLGNGDNAELLVTIAARYGVEITGPRPEQ